MNAGCEAGDPLDSLYVTNLHATTLTQGNTADNYTTRLDELEAIVETIEDHFHNRERWFGATGGVGNDWADSGMTPFQVISGNNTWGAATNVIGTDDTPMFTGGQRFDIHRLLIVANSKATIYRVRLAWGGGTAAQAITADNFSSFMYIRDTVSTQRAILEVMVPDLPTDTKVWMYCWNATNLATIDFYIGLHEYDF